MYQDRYKEYLEKLRKKCGATDAGSVSLAVGYTSNLDILLGWNEKQLQELLDKHLKKEPSYEEGDSIGSMEDLANIIAYFMINGLGAELNITNPQVSKFLQEYFEPSYALGGACAQCAGALGSIGIPAVFSLTDKSRPVCDFLDYPGLYIPTEDGPKTVIQACSGKEPLIHFVWQFTKGQKFTVFGKEYEAPVSTRIILDYDNVNELLLIDDAFMKYCEDNAKKLSVYMISGFNLILDPKVVKERTAQVYAHYAKIKEANPNCVIYMESGHFFSPESRDYIYDKLTNLADVLGMNEDELVLYTSRFGVKTDKDDISSVFGGIREIMSHYPVKGVVLHTKDYSMYFGRELNTDIEESLTMGNLMSGTRARLGKYGTIEECEGTLELPLSPAGLEFAEKIGRMDIPEYVRIVPSRYMERPKFTIGLGDTFSAGVLTGFAR